MSVLGEGTGDVAGRQTMGLEAGRHADIQTGGWTVKEGGWLVINYMERRLERREGGLANRYTCVREHVDKLAGHPGG